jgi:parallel beta-helix repeat protein
LAVSLLSIGLSAATAAILLSESPLVIHPGDDISARVSRAPSGSHFLLKSGVHRRQTIRPRDGMSFVGEEGTVLDGENVTPHAFIAGESRDVTVRGLRITRYAPPKMTAAVEGGSDSRAWLVEGNEIDHTSNAGLRVYGLRIGSGWVVRRNKVHHNGWVGIEGYNAVDTLIEGNEVYANPPSSFSDTVGEAANIKLYGCGRIIVRNNFVHDSPFRGIWLDRSRPDMTVEGNRVVNHGEAGIWYEVSYRGIIRHNYVENAGSNSYYSRGWLRGGGIQVTNSPDVSVIENTVVNSLNGIIGLQADGYEDGPYGPNELRNLLVQGNTVVMPRGQTGIAENIGSPAVFLSWNNRFVGNRYELATNATPFSWMGRNLDERQWQSYPQGLKESFIR